MSLTDPYLQIDDVTFGYSSRVILDDVSLSFGRGQVVAIMGGSGMGKTTLLKLIGGLLKPQKGRIILDGEMLDAADQKELYRLRRKMGMLFQFGALFTDLSVFDNVAFPLREQTDLDEETIRDLVLMKLDAVGLRGAAGWMNQWKNVIHLSCRAAWRGAWRSLARLPWTRPSSCMTNPLRGLIPFRWALPRS